jgi:predicted Zn-dependent protease
LKFRLRFPEGWDITNTAQQVVARQPGESVYLLLQLVEQPQGSLETIAVGSMQRAGFRLMQGDRTDIQGLPAYVGTYRGRTDDLGDSSARAAHIAYDRNVFMLVGLTTSSQFARVQDDFTQSIRSFRRLSSEEVEQIRPNRIDLYVARPGDTWQSIASRASGGAIRAATLAIMNHYSVNELPRAGERIKVVVGS